MRQPSCGPASYCPDLDGLRALAALAVLAFHLRLPGFGGGFLGVDLFFVLSGYLTSRLLLAAGPAITPLQSARFIARRLLRLWPLLAIVATVAAVVLLAVGTTGVVPRELAPTLLFFGNWTIPMGLYPDWLIHSWSLATEMQFYVLMAAAFCLFGQLGRAAMMRVMLAGFIAITLWRSALILGGAGWLEVLYTPTTRGGGLFLGAALACAAWQPTHAQARRIIALAAMVLIAGCALAVMREARSLLVWLPLAEIASAGLVAGLIALQRAGITTALAHPWLVQLGLWSYGIYLWHYPIARLAREAMPAPAALLVTLAVTIPLAALTYRLVETSGLRRASPSTATGRAPG